MHLSIKLDTPIEFINITQYNPLISKCEIKVCYVGDEPNRNHTVITKETAKQMANSLPGSPIVGFFNEEKQDYEEHNKIIEISNGQLNLKETTKPIGFVDLNARVWFQKFLDDETVEREYMMTEGWLWTGQYPECARIIEKGNNQSMELDTQTLQGHWANFENGAPSILIINEAIISKLCVLGQDVEPCFEGASITAPMVQFSLEDDFKNQLLSMMNELKELLSKGGDKMFTKYNVEIGDSLWVNLYNAVVENYTIESVCEENGQKFAVLFANDKYYRMGINILEDGNVEFAAEVEELEGYIPFEEPQFDAAAVAKYAASLNAVEPVTSPENVEDKTVQYNLNEIQEYIELSNNYSTLQNNYQEALTTIEALRIVENSYNELLGTSQELETNYSVALNTINALTAQVEELTQFKASIERAKKLQMIESFYMLSEADKADVTNNIDNYSLDEIEAKLSVICVRNRVSFSCNQEETNQNTTVNLDYSLHDDVPAWVKALRAVSKDN